MSRKRFGFLFPFRILYISGFQSMSWGIFEFVKFPQG